jgi:hypothetical protein
MTAGRALRAYVSATIGFERLGKALGRQQKSLMTVSKRNGPSDFCPRWGGFTSVRNDEEQRTKQQRRKQQRGPDNRN